MNVHILNDLHLEFENFTPPGMDADVVVPAGDIGVGTGALHPRYAQNLLTPAFASDLEGLMDASREALWIHGHVHDAFDYRVHGTWVVCNPRGYAPDQLSEGFLADLVVRV